MIPLLQHRVFNKFRLLRVFLRLFFVAENRREFTDRTAVEVGISRGHEDAGRHAGTRPFGSVAGIRGAGPVAVIGIIDDAVVAVGEQAVRPAFPAFEAVFQHVDVIVIQIILHAGNQEGGADRISGTRAENQRRRAGDGAVSALIVAQIFGDLAENRIRFETIREGFETDRRVVHPAHPFVPLRAVRQQAMRVRAFRRDAVVMNFRDQRASAVEEALLVQIVA